MTDAVHPAALDPAHVAALLDLSADAIITVAPDERVTSWNRGAVQMFGRTADEMVGRDFEILLPDDERARGELQWIHDTTLAEGSIRDHETRRVRKDGVVIDVSLTRTAVRDPDGRLVGFTAILRDIGLRKRLERNLVTSQRLAAAGQMAAAVAHQIGAPLTALSMTIEHLRGMDHVGSDQVAVLQSQTDRITRLARQLVDLAKPPGVKRTPMTAADLVALALGMLPPHLAQKHVHVEVDIEPGLPPLQVDQAQMQQALLHLLLNAHRAAPVSGGRIRITAARRGGAVTLAVRDDGEGIAAKDLPHIFTPFFSRTGGAGLGLAVAAQAVQAHGGTIDAESRPGAGTTLTITLPADTIGD